NQMSTAEDMEIELAETTPGRKLGQEELRLLETKDHRGDALKKAQQLWRSSTDLTVKGVAETLVCEMDWAADSNVSGQQISKETQQRIVAVLAGLEAKKTRIEIAQASHMTDSTETKPEAVERLEEIRRAADDDGNKLIEIEKSLRLA